MTINYLSFDIEDNFEPYELADPGDWHRYEPQVLENTERILELLGRLRQRATFFILGKVARRRPEIVQIIHDQNHEIACHGFQHQRAEKLEKPGSSRMPKWARKRLRPVHPVT